MALILFFSLIMAAVVAVPQYMIVLLALNFCTGLFLSAFHIASAFLPRSVLGQRKLSKEPPVAVLVPAYNEPPAILMQTLEKLSQLSYANYEVFVIDNNTKDEEVWKPVEAFVHDLGDKFHFFHEDHLAGFKAGALNVLLRKIPSETEYVAVIDADYLVRPDFLSTALEYFVNRDIALVQFPQHYRNTNKESRPISDEYRHFFGIYMNMSNNLNCVPSTGTMSVYRFEALRKIGGFRGESLTEDADAGLRIYGAGYRGVFVNRPMGYGLMPYDLESYRKQKWRWAFGNAQSLKTLAVLFGTIPLRSWIGFSSHLTAWHHFHFFSFAALAAVPLLLLSSDPLSADHRNVFLFASLSLLVTIVSRLILFFMTFYGQKEAVSRTMQAFAVHMGMTLIYSEAWIACFFRVKSGFERTNKFILHQKPSLLKNTRNELFLGLWFLFGVSVSLLRDEPAMSVTFLLAATALFCIFYVYRKIFPIKLYSRKFLETIEKKYLPYLEGRNLL